MVLSKNLKANFKFVKPETRWQRVDTAKLREPQVWKLQASSQSPISFSSWQDCHEGNDNRDEKKETSI